MANCLFLLNAGGNILLNAGGALLLNDDSCGVVPGGDATGRVRKKVGRQLVSDNLGNRPSSITSGESKGKIIFKAAGLTKAKTKLKLSNESKARKIPHQTGESIARIIFKTVNESISKQYYKHTMESFGIIHPSIQMGRQIRLQKLSILKEIADKITSLEKPSSIRTFSFNEIVHDEQLIAFTNSSSFVGNVRYNTDTLEMRVLLNGKAYNFCNVPRRIYDAFEGAPSPGAYFGRNIRTQFDC